MKKIGLFIITFLFCISVSYADTTKEEATFVRCVDGDTALLRIGDEDIKVRFLAIDTPETVHPTKEVEAYGKDASEYTCNKLTSAKYIVVEYENSNKTDKYGRTLAWIWIDGSLLQKELISAGYAEVAYIYGKYKYTESLCVVQQDAKKNKNGIWSEDRKEGYCSTLDLTGVEDTIEKDYDLPSSEKEKTKEKDPKEIEKDLTKKVDKASKALDKFNELDIDNYLLYIIIGAAIFSLVFKKKK